MAVALDDKRAFVFESTSHASPVLPHPAVKRTEELKHKRTNCRTAPWCSALDGFTRTRRRLLITVPGRSLQYVHSRSYRLLFLGELTAPCMCIRIPPLERSKVALSDGDVGGCTWPAQVKGITGNTPPFGSTGQSKSESVVRFTPLHTASVGNHVRSLTTRRFVYSNTRQGP